MTARNWIPASIAFAPALLLPLVQVVVRPHVHVQGALAVGLGSAPNFVIGLCFPFAGVMRPSLFTRRTGDAVFGVASFLTAGTLIAAEYGRPVRMAQTYDPKDILASILGVAVSALLYVLAVRPHLGFGRWAE